MNYFNFVVLIQLHENITKASVFFIFRNSATILKQQNKKYKAKNVLLNPQICDLSSLFTQAQLNFSRKSWISFRPLLIVVYWQCLCLIIRCSPTWFIGLEIKVGGRQEDEKTRQQNYVGHYPSFFLKIQKNKISMFETFYVLFRMVY